MIIFDFFSGTGSATQAFKDNGHQVITFEIDYSFNATEHCNIMELKADYLLNQYGQPDFIWASPPCTTFSVASISHHWISGGHNPEPRTEEAKSAQELVHNTLNLIKELQPTYGWLLENPRGMLRKLPVTKGLLRRTITYCAYGETRMKPTDLWGDVQGWTSRNPCKNGMTCHQPAPRGSKTGTQGIKLAKDKSRVPYQLSQELLFCLEKVKAK